MAHTIQLEDALYTAIAAIALKEKRYTNRQAGILLASAIEFYNRAQAEQESAKAQQDAAKTQQESAGRFTTNLRR